MKNAAQKGKPYANCKKALVCLSFSVLASALMAAEYTVDSVSSLKTRIKDAADGDTIILKAGVYDLSGQTPTRQSAKYPIAYLVIASKKLILRGENETSWRAKQRSEESIIKGGDKAAILYAHGVAARNSAFYNLTFEDACYTNDTVQFAFGGGAISFVATDGDGVVSNCVFRNCRTDKNGGALCYIDAIDSYFTNCTSSASGGAVYGGFRTGPATNRFLNCLFEYNTAKDRGGAVYCNPALKVEGCVFRGNKARYGAGLSGDPDEFYGEVLNCEFSDNQGDELLKDRSDHNRGTHVTKFRRVENCKFSGSGDVYVPEIDRCQFSGCSQRYIDNYSGLITFDATSGDGFIRNSLFDHCAGPRLITTSGTTAAIENCTFADNILSGFPSGDVKKGYFIYAFRGYDKIDGDLVAPSTNVTVNCIFANNKVGDYSADVNFYRTTGLVVSPSENIVSNCVYGTINKSDVAWNAPAIEENFVQRTVSFVKSNQSRYPNVAPYTPKTRTGVVDCGVKLDWMDGALDLAGNPRVKGTACDLGCYERWFSIGLAVVFW